nr:MAG TPA: hypothetical protein [Caudoviricetes sp.]
MNYPTYANNSQFYMQNLQDMRDRIDSQIRNYQQNQTQQPVTQPITQNFQLAPNPTNNELEAKYVDNIEAVKNTFVIKTGIFLNKDFSTLWIKDVTGKIRTFATEEIIEMDEKDKEIYQLKKQIEEMKGMIENDNKSDNTNVDDEITKTKSSRVSSSKRSNAK